MGHCASATESCVGDSVNGPWYMGNNICCQNPKKASSGVGWFLFGWAAVELRIPRIFYSGCEHFTPSSHLLFPQQFIFFLVVILNLKIIDVRTVFL